MTRDRRQAAYHVRVEAAELAKNRHHPLHRANGDEQRYAHANYCMSFTKGLPHRNTTGLIADARDFEAFRNAINEGFIERFSFNVPVATACNARRKWEAPTAGIAFELQGPDAQSVTMAPPPPLGSDELAYEMAEVYELALIRDEPLTALRAGAGNGTVMAGIERLNGYAYRPAEGKGRPRKTDASGDVDEQTVFRGSSPGVEAGPYLSQFMLIGTADASNGSAIADGLISYGANQIEQKVPVASTTNYMITKDDWLEVQRGCVVGPTAFDSSVPRRFIVTPRDLATYVHVDALYQAYLNACLILLNMGTPFDPGFGNLSGQAGLFHVNPNGSHSTFTRQAGGFALYGGPHILSLVTEVATRGLKAVRFQKFNTHLRLRPEALAGRIELAQAIEAEFPGVGARFQEMATSIEPTVAAVRTLNGGTAFLPMAFSEGSPMHPSYGAGHATVAGACVTILKAYFDTSTAFVRRQVNGQTVEGFFRPEAGDTPLAYVPNGAGSALVAETDGPFLTLEGELNKLAANIAIARNMAGVHYFTDYYDSLRMGEEIAIGILEEQALCYETDPFVLSVPTFDGEMRRVGAR